MGYEVFAYADDLAIVGYHKAKLKKCIRTAEKWADENNMTINRKKSGIIFHMKRSKYMDPNKEELFKGYPIKPHYKYLGIYLD